jgi:hypothetical protein
VIQHALNRLKLKAKIKVLEFLVNPCDHDQVGKDL